MREKCISTILYRVSFLYFSLQLRYLRWHDQQKVLAIARKNKWETSTENGKQMKLRTNSFWHVFDKLSAHLSRAEAKANLVSLLGAEPAPWDMPSSSMAMPAVKPEDMLTAETIQSGGNLKRA
jgi:hypothetical protein